MTAKATWPERGQSDTALLGRVPQCHLGWQTGLGASRLAHHRRAPPSPIHTEVRAISEQQLSSMDSALREVVETRWWAVTMEVFSQRVHKYSFVDRVYGYVDSDKSVHLWTALSTDNRGDRGQIYEEQGKMYEDYPDTRFDFFVLCVPRLKKPLSETIPSSFNVLSGR